MASSLMLPYRKGIGYPYRCYPAGPTCTCLYQRTPYTRTSPRQVLNFSNTAKGLFTPGSGATPGSRSGAGG